MGLLDSLVAVKAERALQQHAREEFSSLPPETLAKMAALDIPFIKVVPAHLKVQLDPARMRRLNPLVRQGVEHLSTLSDERLLVVLEGAIPEHVAVFRRYPAYTLRSLQAIRGMISAALAAL